MQRGDRVWWVRLRKGGPRHLLGNKIAVECEFRYTIKRGGTEWVELRELKARGAHGRHTVPMRSIHMTKEEAFEACR